MRGEPDAVDLLGQRMRIVPRVLAAQNARSGRPLDVHELADLTQDALTVAWSKLSRFDASRPLDAWLCRIGIFESSNFIRKKRRRANLLEGVARDMDGRHHASSMGEWGGHEELYRELERLDAPQADVIRLRHFENRSFEEAASELRVPLGTAKSNYYRGLVKLRGVLQQERLVEGEHATP